MPSFIPLSLAATAAPPPKTLQPPFHGTAAKNENSFSRQLEQSRRTPAQASARAAPQSKPPAPPAASPAASANQPPAKPEVAARNEAARAARPAPPRDRAAPADGHSTSPQVEPQSDLEADAKAEAVADAEAGTDAETTDPAVDDLFALWAPPPDAPLPPPADAALATISLAPVLPLAPTPQPGVATTSTAAGAATPDTDTDTTGLAGSASDTVGAGARPEALRLPAQASAPDAREPTGSATPDPGTWQQAQAAAVRAEGAHKLRDTIDENPVEPASASDRTLAGLGLGGLSGAASHAGKPGDVPTVNLATPATSAEFRAALGAQVSWFARAGVQQAELHLNPADMGPVSIQIVLDGQQAQVNFGADSALTRQIIESGMPELAGALRDAGLTLTGGGVSQHSGGQRQDPNAHGTPGGSASNARPGASADSSTDPQAEQSTRSALRSSAGGIDLYA